MCALPTSEWLVNCSCAVYFSAFIGMLEADCAYSGTSLNGLSFMRKPLYCAQFTRNGTHRRIMPIHFALSIAETSAFRIANEICILT